VARGRPCGAGKFSAEREDCGHGARNIKDEYDQVTQDAIVTGATSAGTSRLKEIDFGHQKQALVFDQNPGGM
jgi:hypothetical protein